MVSLPFVAGLLAGAGITLLANMLRQRKLASSASRPRLLLAAVLVVGFAAAAALLYYVTGTAHAPAHQAANTAAMDTAAGSGAAAGPAKSMQDAVAGLEARLGRGEGSDADWTLLAQAYEFLGRHEDAERARAHSLQPGVVPLGRMSAGSLIAAAAAVGATPAGAAPAAAAPVATAPSATAPSATALAKRVAAVPTDGAAWLALADARRAARDYDGARTAYEKAVALNVMTAQAWADYADVLGTLAKGSLAGAPARAIDRALALDATNMKALWLEASLEFEQHRYGESLGTWRRLRALLPAGSPDAAVIDANIAEAAALAGAAGPGSATAPASAAAGVTTGAPVAELTGTVSVDARLAAKVRDGATLFIYAKAADSPGPPLAVVRTAATAWPVSFRLDDSMAMMPSRRLSQFDKVVVEARISRSGQATPAAGDLYVTSPVVHPAPGAKLALVIDHEIG